MNRSKATVSRSLVARVARRIDLQFRAAFGLETVQLYCDTSDALISDSVQEWTRTDIAAARLHADTPYSESSIAERKSDGARLFALEEDGQTVSFGWVTVARRFYIGEVGGWCDAGMPVAWIWDCVTPIGHRGKGYYTRLLRGIRGLRLAEHCAIFCRKSNVASRKGIEKAGFQKAGQIRVTRWTTRTTRSAGSDLDFRFERAPRQDVASERKALS